MQILKWTIGLLGCGLINAGASAQVPQHRWWYFGFGAGLDMSTVPPAALSDGALSTDEGVASIADANGQLLFYTNGETIWNRNHAPMPGGTGLPGHFSSSQSVLIVPDPAVDTRFFVFTTPNSAGMYGGPDALAYTVVDMSLNNGLGAVAQPSQFLIGPVPEKLAATRHANGRDTWVLVHGWGNADYHAFLVTCGGVLGPVTSSAGRTMGPDGAGSPLPALGCMQFNAQGDRLAATWAEIDADFVTSNQLDILAFDNATGQLTAIAELTHEQPGHDLRGYGVCFSPNGARLYVSEYGLVNGIGHSHILQYDMGAADIASTEQVVAGPVNDAFGTLQRAPDGRIYAARLNGSTFLSCITAPNEAGAACGFVGYAVALNAPSTWGLPHHWDTYPPHAPPYMQLRDTTLCEGGAILLDATVAHPLITASHVWNDGSTDPVLLVDESGHYSVQVVLGCDTLTATAHVRFGGIAFDLGPDRFLCMGDSAELRVPAGAAQWWWSDGATDSLRTVADGTYALSVADSAGCGASSSITLTEADCSCEVWVPNAFTPNGDGFNEAFGPIQQCALRRYELTLYDRWGRAIWRTADPEEAWDGKDSPDAIYTWRLELRWWDGVAERDRELMGHVTVLR